MNDNRHTPRDLLLTRHAPKTATLDALRRAALPPPDLTWLDLLREIFTPHRTAWSALAAMWLLLAVFHLTHPVSTPPTGSPITSPATYTALLRDLKSYETFSQIDQNP